MEQQQVCVWVYISLTHILVLYRTEVYLWHFFRLCGSFSRLPGEGLLEQPSEEELLFFSRGLPPEHERYGGVLECMVNFN